MRPPTPKLVKTFKFGGNKDSQIAICIPKQIREQIQLEAGDYLSLECDIYKRTVLMRKVDVDGDGKAK